MAASFGPAAAETPAPSQWPNGLRYGSATNALRIGGPDRYHTSLAMALALRGRGGYPFTTPDRTSVNAPTLAAAGEWWGPATCPRSVILVAGDTPADALAAASLSDPTNRSDEPRLERTAAADPFFDPVGGVDRVDTAAAPIVVTASRRSGARGLSEAARVAIGDLARGGCTTVREAIVIGGSEAVPTEVDDELVALGLEEVFRVAGADRYATAAAIAAALGTEPAPVDGTCVDARTDDGDARMGFYGNSVIEYRPTASACELHGRAVVLADGDVGADALAAGWWTSFWQVPVLLAAADGTLPPATQYALGSMAIDTVVVLGGTGRIPEATVEEATRLAGAVAGRFAGADRYETSAVTARAFGGWHATGNASDFEGDRVCLAASSGRAGWPDALAAGPWCGVLAASRTASPTRAHPPATSPSAIMTAIPPAHDAAPVLLVPAGVPAPTRAITGLLDTSFGSSGGWCTGATAPDCVAPGFAVAFGGTATVSDALLTDVSARLAGDVSGSVPTPAAGPLFGTRLDLSPVFALGGPGGPDAGCMLPGDASSLRWLALYTPALDGYRGGVDLVSRELVGDPVCLAYDRAATDAVIVGVAPWGESAGSELLRGGDADTVDLSAELVHAAPVESNQEPLRYSFRDQPMDVTLRRGPITSRVVTATLDLRLNVDANGTAAVVQGEATLDLEGAAPLVVAVRGEARLIEDRWEIAGSCADEALLGGFRATVRRHGTRSAADDAISWRLDGMLR